MSDSIISRFLAGTISTGIGRLSTVVLGLLGFILTSRWLSLEDLGTFTLIQVIVAFLVGLSDMGLTTSLTRFLAGTENEQDKSRIINTALYFRIIVLVVTSILALVAREVLFSLFGGSLLIELIIFIPILFIIESLFALLNSVLEGLFKFRVIGMIEIITSVTSFLSILVLVVWQDQSILGRIYARMIAMSLALIIAYFFSGIKHQFVFDFDILKKMLRFGFPLFLNYILSFLFMRADTLIIGALLGAKEIGIYEVARKIPESLDMVYSAFRQVYFPFVSKLYLNGALDKVANMLNHTLRLFTYFGLAGAMLVFILGDKIIVLLFSEKYLPGAFTFGLLMVVFNFTVVEYTQGISLVAIGDSDKPPLITIFHTTFSIIGNLVLIPVWGIAGAALASMVGSAAVNPINVFFLRRRKIDAKFSPYLLSFAVFSVYLLVVFAVKPTLWAQILILIAYLLSGLVFSIITVDDASLLFREGKHLINKLRIRLGFS